MLVLLDSVFMIISKIHLQVYNDRSGERPNGQPFVVSVESEEKS